MDSLTRLEQEVDEYRAEARAILDAADDDLTGEAAARFDTLAEQIESHSSEIAEVRARNARANELVRSVQDGRMRVEAGTPGRDGVQPYTGDHGRRPSRSTLPAVGQVAPPLPFDERQLRQLFTAAEARTSFAISAPSTRDLRFSTAEPDLPPQLSPTVLGPVYESRLMDRLPTMALSRW